MRVAGPHSVGERSSAIQREAPSGLAGPSTEEYYELYENMLILLRVHESSFCLLTRKYVVLSISKRVWLQVSHSHSSVTKIYHVPHQASHRQS